MTITEFVTEHCPALEEAAALTDSGRPSCPSSCLLHHPMWLQDPASPPASPLDTQIPWIPQFLFLGSLESPVFGVSPGRGWMDGAIPSPQCLCPVPAPAFPCAVPGCAPCCLSPAPCVEGTAGISALAAGSCLAPGLWERLWKIPEGLCCVQPVALSNPDKSLSSLCLMCRVQVDFMCLKLI